MMETLSNVNSGKFIADSCYYSISVNKESQPSILTWKYDGTRIIRGCSSKSCDVPNQYYVFKLNCEGEQIDKELIIPSLRHAESRFFTWIELQEEIIHLKQVYKHLR